MVEHLLVCYLVGLIVFASAIGNYVASAPIGFMIFGGGLIIYAAFMGILRYLTHGRG